MLLLLSLDSGSQPQRGAMNPSLDGTDGDSGLDLYQAASVRGKTLGDSCVETAV